MRAIHGTEIAARMMGKKQILSRVLQRAKLFSLLGGLRRDLLVVFGYHRIVPDARHRSAFADDVHGQTVSELEASLAWLKEHTHLISEPELIRAIERGVK